MLKKLLKYEFMSTGRVFGLCYAGVLGAALLLRMAANQLNAREQADFAADMETRTDDSLSRVADELEWFTLKFDYRNADKPWGNSRDALERAVTKLRGWCVGAELGAKK